MPPNLQYIKPNQTPDCFPYLVYSITLAMQCASLSSQNTMSTWLKPVFSPTPTGPSDHGHRAQNKLWNCSLKGQLLTMYQIDHLIYIFGNCYTKTVTVFTFSNCFYILVFYKNEIRTSTAQDLPTQIFCLCLKAEELIRTLSLGWYVTLLSTAAF